MTKLLIDTDCGIDDAVALWWAASQADVELVGITTVFGNVDLADAAANALRVLELAGRPDTPIAFGADRPFGPAPELRRADFIHGADGVGDTGRRPTGDGARPRRPPSSSCQQRRARRPGRGGRRHHRTDDQHRPRRRPGPDVGAARAPAGGDGRGDRDAGQRPPGGRGEHRPRPARRRGRTRCAVDHAAAARRPGRHPAGDDHAGPAEPGPRRPDAGGHRPRRAADVLRPLRRHVLRSGRVPLPRRARRDGCGTRRASSTARCCPPRCRPTSARHWG